MENSITKFSKAGRTLAPILLFISCLFIFAVAERVFKFKSRQFIGRLNLFYILLISTSLIASFSSVLISTFTGPIYSGSSTVVGYGASTRESPGSISYNYVKAGRWVQENIESTELFFTNRQCFNSKSTENSCYGYWFYASALTKRSFLIEGGVNTDFQQNAQLEMSKDGELSYRFARSPSRRDLDELWARNVRWGWIDRQVSNISDWKGLANEIYSNHDIAIIELVDPKKLGDL
jgi:hypothetical protein